MIRARTSSSPYTGPAMPDRRLASMFAPRSTSAPATATSVTLLAGYAADIGGLSTFAGGLRAGLLADRPDLTVNVVQALAAPEGATSPEIVHRLADGVDGARAAAAVMNQGDAAIIHYQDGVYGGTEGDQVLDVLEWITRPVIVIIQDLHQQPTARQRFITELLTSSADAVVTLSETGRRLLLDQYHVEPRKLSTIRHGAQLTAASVPDMRPDRPRRRTNILTWGLLGPGRGIETGLHALALAGKLGHAPRYTIAGPLDPSLGTVDGDRYRHSLLELAGALGISDRVEFHIGRLGSASLAALVHGADAVLLPQGGSDPTFSSVFADAMTVARPLVCASNVFAREVLHGERGGLLVPPGDAAATADALVRVLSEPALAKAMSAHNAAAAPIASWPDVAARYRQLINALMRRPLGE
ncbi:glycosyltransferase involved in cell wall biosynthesis [Hamadaea flava]|uniref:Glycosyltransferase n=1 Tax=Hamadaea flava TaxID=1742688 RepID=A0ABV8LPW3_9ACTN|nr:glycosyltransferase [Hamadaea flava]MCP2322829.1 glycosyltransferase involved in cell wall biosynthesis [Hamadaea flava]